jgi:uncharacterized protein YjbI with pentapeptide repeats
VKIISRRAVGRDGLIPWARITLVGVVLVAGLSLMTFVLTGRERFAHDATLRLNEIKVWLALVGGYGAAVTLWLALRRQAHHERDTASQRQFEVDTEAKLRAADADRRDAELYSVAATQLASPQPAVRLAGLYSFDRLAQRNTSFRQTVVDVLCAYLRMPPPRALIDHMRDVANPLSDADAGELEVRLTSQRLLVEHFQPREAERFWVDVKTDFNGARLHDFNASGATLTGDARFDRAIFSGDANFTDATFCGRASFMQAVFITVAAFERTLFLRDVEFSRATFEGEARFRRATFTRDANFDAAEFAGDARFDAVTFAGEANLARATLTGGAAFFQATFAGDAIFDHARFIGRARFYEAMFTGGTTFAQANFSDEARFDRATFIDNARFDRTSFEDYTSFNSATFVATLVWRDESYYNPPALPEDPALLGARRAQKPSTYSEWPDPDY